jgi:hypothetical protein
MFYIWLQTLGPLWNKKQSGVARVIQYKELPLKTTTLLPSRIF